MNMTGTIHGINGPIVYIIGNQGFRMGEMVLVGTQGLVGEVIGLNKKRTTIQVYEETTGLRPGEEVHGTGGPISVTLAPGIISNIFDGIERPLKEISNRSGAFISRGISVESLDTKRLWDVHITVSVGDKLYGGHVIATVQETKAILHKSHGTTRCIRYCYLCSKRW
jgi:V/A-type H+-transporting ATPase subunit A